MKQEMCGIDTTTNLQIGAESLHTNKGLFEHTDTCTALATHTTVYSNSTATEILSHTARKMQYTLTSPVCLKPCRVGSLSFFTRVLQGLKHDTRVFSSQIILCTHTSWLPQMFYSLMKYIEYKFYFSTATFHRQIIV